MTQRITISPWPSTFNNPRWSQDGELAVALGEYVEIIIPKLRSGQQSIKDVAAKGLAWDHVRLRVNHFTEDESPTIEPASHRTWSIGEEISIISTTAIEWTPPGLTLYKRSALGVLTSNHVLSLWAPDARPNLASQWGRKLVINRLLRSGGSQDVAADRRCHRIRAFAFSSIGCNQNAGSADIFYNKDCYLLSLVNDVGEIFVVKISSPFVPFEKGESWSAIVVARYQTDVALRNDLSLRSSILSDYLAPHQIVSHIDWSEWYLREDGAHVSILAFASERVRCCRVAAILEANGTKFEIEIDKDTHLQELNLYNGPLGWVPRAFSVSASPLLYSFGKNDLRCTEVSIIDLSYSENSVCNYDNRWDVITGVAFCWTPSNIVAMYSSMHIYKETSKTFGINFSTSGTQLRGAQDSVWEAEILTELSQFKAEHSLPSDPFARIWGMASSPLNAYVCISYSLHPSNMLEYTIPAEQICYLRIAPCQKPSDTFRVPITITGVLEEGTSTEAAALTLQLWLKDRQIEDVDEIFKMMLKDIASVQDISAFVDNEKMKRSRFEELLLSSAASNTSKLIYLIKYLKHSVNSDSEYIVNRARFLLLSAFSIHFSLGDLSAFQLYHVVKCVLDMPEVQLRPMRLSKIIKHHFLLATESDVSQKNGSDVTGVSEICDICQTVITFESTTWAKCASGHVYSRCGLTMVAIQVPGISKFCGICGQQFLRDEYSANSLLVTENNTDAPHKEHNTISKNDGSMEVSLVEVLFAACDTCLYCGGKYLG